MVAERLALMDVGDVDLDDRTTERTDAVVECHGSMGISTGVEHDAVEGEAHLLHLVDKLALDVALVVGYLDIGETGLQLGQILVERRRTVDARLTGS